jgi:predicted DNA-binding transcriptional regulator YafY
MRIPLSPTQAPALAIAVFVRERGAAYSAEILNAFDISESTLRRRRAELRRLGIEFVPRGRESIYYDSGITRHLPGTYPLKQR